MINRQKVVHAYGAQGAFVFGFGVANEAARLVNEYVYELDAKL